MDRARLRTFLLGGAAGMLAGVLLAPRSGRELRGSLADRAGEARERRRETAFERREMLRERWAARREDRARPAPPEHQAGPDAEAPPNLRDVSGTGASPEPEGEADRSEELRRKVRETRERLRGRQDIGRGPEA